MQKVLYLHFCYILRYTGNTFGSEHIQGQGVQGRAEEVEGH